MQNLNEDIQKISNTKEQDKEELKILYYKIDEKTGVTDFVFKIIEYHSKHKDKDITMIMIEDQYLLGYALQTILDLPEEELQDQIINLYNQAHQKRLEIIYIICHIFFDRDIEPCKKQVIVNAVTQDYEGKTLLSHTYELDDKQGLSYIIGVLITHCTVEEMTNNIKKFFIEQTSKHAYEIFFDNEEQLKTIVRTLQKNSGHKLLFFKLRFFLNRIKQMNTTINLATHNRNNIKQSNYKLYKFIRYNLANEKI